MYTSKREKKKAVTPLASCTIPDGTEKGTEEGKELGMYLLVVAGFGPIETRQDHVFCLVAHPDSLLQGDFGEDAGGLQDVPLRHRLRRAGEVPVGAVVGALMAALGTHSRQV